MGEGLLARAGALLAPVLPQKRAVVVTDATVARLHLPALLAGLAETAIAAQPIVVGVGETEKSIEAYARLVDGLLEAGVERRTAVIALGGGVVGDLAGFAAATTLRGLPFVQMPTTLLAQVDSSVGGKTGVNTQRGKNLVGAFHQPRMVLADTATLASLPPRELRAGYAEIAKAGLIADAALFAWCEANGAALVHGERAIQAEAVHARLRLQGGRGRRRRAGGKAGGRPRAAQSRPHLRPCAGGGMRLWRRCCTARRWRSGSAWRSGSRPGSACARRRTRRGWPRISMRSGCRPELRVLNRRLSAGRLIAHMRRDKKTRDGRMIFVLARGIGAAFTSAGRAGGGGGGAAGGGGVRGVGEGKTLAPPQIVRHSITTPRHCGEASN